MPTTRTMPTLVLLLALLILAACVAPAPVVTLPPSAGEAPGSAEVQVPATPPTAPAPSAASTPVARGPRFGPRSGMMDRHHATVPAEFAGLQSPVPADPESLARGQELYATNCASCHGDTGMGEGPAGEQLDPPAAPVAHTSQMLGDGYLFWRITEGGHAFGTAMPIWRDALDEQARWDLINYMRALGQGDFPPGMMGRGPGPRAGEAEHRAAMLAEAVALGALTQEEADFFEQVHQVLDEQYAADAGVMEQMAPRGMMAMQRALTGQAVRDGYITAADADRFTEIHDRLLQAGVMP